MIEKKLYCSFNCVQESLAFRKAAGGSGQADQSKARPTTWTVSIMTQKITWEIKGDEKTSPKDPKGGVLEDIKLSVTS